MIAPERIWAAGGWEDDPNRWTSGLWDLEEDGGGDVQYVRADLHTALLADRDRLAAEVERLQQQRDRTLVDMARRSPYARWVCPDCGVSGCRHWQMYADEWLPKAD